MICTLRDELMQRCQEIIQLETSLSSAKQQVTSNEYCTFRNSCGRRSLYVYCFLSGGRILTKNLKDATEPQEAEDWCANL